jgi:hypothetical protein
LITSIVARDRRSAAQANRRATDSLDLRHRRRVEIAFLHTIRKKISRMILAGLDALARPLHSGACARESLASCARGARHACKKAAIHKGFLHHWKILGENLRRAGLFALLDKKFAASRAAFIVFVARVNASLRRYGVFFIAL